MFKDLEEDQDEHTSQADMLESSLTCPNQRPSEESTNPQQRVTMLFDEDEEESKKVGGEKIKEEQIKLDDRIVEEPPQVALPIVEKEENADMAENNHLEVPNITSAKATKETATKLGLSANTKKPVNTVKSVKKTKTEDVPVNDKRNWLVKLFQNFSSHNNGTKISKNHVTSISFDDAHMLTLNEFNKNSIDYQLKNLDHKFGRKTVEYDCKFVEGNFKFKIKISSLPNASTVITVKRRSKNSNTTSDKASF